MKIAIFGVGGIGKFHAREFSSAGCEVVAILGSSEKDSEETADMLKKKFGISARSYYDIQNLLENEELDAVSICTPPNLHYDHVFACLKKGLNVLCEKPFVGNDKGDKFTAAKTLLDLAKSCGKIVSVNTQWPSVLPVIKNYVDILDVRRFEIYMEPGVSGFEMLEDHFPHMNSMLVYLIPNGHIDNLRFLKKSVGEIVIEFDYVSDRGICAVKYSLKFKKDRPRNIRFSINGNEFTRRIGESYNQSLMFNGNEIPIKDPFSVSINDFVSSVRGGNGPLVSSQQILENVKIQEEIERGFNK